MATKKKAKKRRRRQAGPKKGGVMVGMRSGFKNLASSGKKDRPKKKTWVSTAITILLVLATAAILYYRS